MNKCFRIFIIASFCILSGCGIETGNPTSEYQNGIIPIPDSGTYTSALAESLCGVIERCVGSIPDECKDDLMFEDNITNELGLNDSTYPDLSSVEIAENNSTLGVDSTEFQICIEEMSYLNCTDTLITDAYSEGDPENYTNMYKLLQADLSCANIYH